MLGTTPADKTSNLGYLYHVLEVKRKQVRTIKGVEEGSRRTETPFLALNRILYDPIDPRAARVSKAALEESMGGAPPVTVKIQAYQMSREAEIVIEEQNQRIADLITGIRTGGATTKLKEIQDARRVIELQKVPTFVNLAVDALGRGRSVILFVEYHQTSELLFEMLSRYRPRLYTGETKRGARQPILDAFQQGEFDLLIAHHAVAREGVSMHDIIGGHPRTVIISPCWGGITAIQVLGRADRLCRLSDTEQIIVYAQTSNAGGKAKFGWDARVAEVMRSKIHNITELNEGEEAAGTAFMQSLYATAKTVKTVDYVSKPVKLSAKRFSKALVIGAQPKQSSMTTEAERAAVELEHEDEEG